MEEKTIVGIGCISIGALLIFIGLFIWSYKGVTIGQGQIDLTGVIFLCIGIIVFGIGMIICLIRFIKWVWE